MSLTTQDASTMSKDQWARQGRKKDTAGDPLLVLEGARRHIYQIGILVNGFWAGRTVNKVPNISPKL